MPARTTSAARMACIVIFSTPPSPATTKDYQYEIDPKYLHAEALAHPQHEEHFKQKKAMYMLEHQETEYWKKKAREN